MTVSKAIAGALVTALVALLARHGVVVDQSISDIINVVVAAIIGFVGVYIAPPNRPR